MQDPNIKQMAEQIARVRLLASEARKRGLDKDAATQSRIRFQEDNLLAGAVYNDLVKQVVVDDAALQKYYDFWKKNFLTTKCGSGTYAVLSKDADHSFAVRKRSGRDAAGVMQELLDASIAWLRGEVAAAR